MTKKRALEKSIELWEELKELKKENYTLSLSELKILYFDNIPEYNEPENYCYLCEYAQCKCDKCPVKNWSIYRKNGGVSKACWSTDSIYTIGSTKERIDNVLELLKETYNDLYNK